MPLHHTAHVLAESFSAIQVLASGTPLLPMCCRAKMMRFYLNIKVLCACCFRVWQSQQAVCFLFKYRLLHALFSDLLSNLVFAHSCCRCINMQDHKYHGSHLPASCSRLRELVDTGRGEFGPHACCAGNALCLHYTAMNWMKMEMNRRKAEQRPTEANGMASLHSTRPPLKSDGARGIARRSSWSKLLDT